MEERKGTQKNIKHLKYKYKCLTRETSFIGELIVRHVASELYRKTRSMALCRLS